MSGGQKGLVLQGKKVLIVEDQFMIADELQAMIERLGGRVLGPVSSVAAAMAILSRDMPQIALLDVNLGVENVYPVAMTLQAASVPFVFTTGYDANVIDARFRHVPHLEKPIHEQSLTGLLRQFSQAP